MRYPDTIMLERGDKEFIFHTVNNAVHGMVTVGSLNDALQGMVTAGSLNDALRGMVTMEFFDAAINNLARMIGTSFQAVEEKMATKKELAALTERVDGLERSVMGIHDHFAALFAEIRHIREEIKTVDCRAEVADLQVRVGALEDKVRTLRAK